MAALLKKTLAHSRGRFWAVTRSPSPSHFIQRPPDTAASGLRWAKRAAATANLTVIQVKRLNRLFETVFRLHTEKPLIFPENHVGRIAIPSPLSAGSGRVSPSFLRRLFDHPAFILPRDFTLFLAGARTDAAIARTRKTQGARSAFEAAYTASSDPWASATPRYRYQQRKYEQIMAILPDKRYGNVLDVGCGLGLLSQHLAARSGRVLGIDLASAALGHAGARAAGITNLSFQQGDVLNLPQDLNGKFDLVVVADVLYYLSPLSDDLLKVLSARFADLLTHNGTCLLVNHYFFSADHDSRLSRRIHDAFVWSPRFSVLSQHRKAFFLATVLRGQETIAIP